MVDKTNISHRSIITKFKIGIIILWITWTLIKVNLRQRIIAT